MLNETFLWMLIGMATKTSLLFVCFPNDFDYCCQQMQGAYQMYTVINTLIPKSD